jgi:hypothetical protein
MSRRSQMNDRNSFHSRSIKNQTWKNVFLQSGHTADSSKHLSDKNMGWVGDSNAWELYV